MSEDKNWNRADTLERLGGDEELLQELAGIFAAESPKLMKKLHDAVSCGDAELTMRGAHSIKGELSCLGGVSAAAIAQQLETMGRNKELSGAGETFIQLEAELAAFSLLLTRPATPKP